MNTERIVGILEGRSDIELMSIEDYDLIANVYDEYDVDGTATYYINSGMTTKTGNKNILELDADLDGRRLESAAIATYSKRQHATADKLLDGLANATFG